jgi:hypothetical protein
VRGTWQTTDSGGGGLVLVVIIAALAVGSGAASAAVSALVTIAIVLAAVIGLAVLGAAAVLVHRARSDRPGRPIPARVVSRVPPESRPQLEVSHISAVRKTSAQSRPAGGEITHPDYAAIEPPREIHVHLNVSPDQLAAILRHYTEEE